MVSIRPLITLGLLAFSYAAGQQCDQAIEDFHTCLRDSEPKRQNQGQRSNFEQLKQKADQCFTANNCEPPQSGPGGPRGEGGPGGRAGRFGPNSNNQCFKTVESKLKDERLQCMRKTDPNFNFPNKPNGGGPGGPPGGHGHGPHGGPEGPGGPQGGEQFLLKACNNNQAAADKVKSCLATVFPHPQQGGDNQQEKAEFEQRCQAKAACEAKLGSCKDVMQQRETAMCNCENEVRAKRQELFSTEPACKQQQGQDHPQPNGGKGRDCDKEHVDYCQKGYDAMIADHPVHHGGN